MLSSCGHKRHTQRGHQNDAKVSPKKKESSGESVDITEYRKQMQKSCGWKDGELEEGRKMKE